MQSYPAYKSKSDSELEVVLGDALAVFLDLTHRSEDPGDVVDSLICDIAKNLLAHAGTEGIILARDGEIQRKWSDANGGIDPAIVKRIMSYRQVVGVNATPLL